jgi:hypothetical protein
MAVSLSEWLRVSGIALDLDYAFELIADYSDVVREVEIWEDGERYVLYEGLDDLFIAENLYCSIGDATDDMVVGRNHYVYLMRIYNARDQYFGVVKVGVSRQPLKRAEALTEAWGRKKLTFRVDKVGTGNWSKRKMYGLEAAIHVVLRRKGLQYDAGVKYDGYTELFKVNDKDLEMIRWML